jgi:hypothetical protein
LGASRGWEFTVKLFNELNELRDGDPGGCEVPFVAADHSGGSTVTMGCSGWAAAACCWVGQWCAVKAGVGAFDGDGEGFDEFWCGGFGEADPDVAAASRTGGADDVFNP